MILFNPYVGIQDIDYIALSPNSETLAYQLFERVDNGNKYSIRTIDIDSCGGADACTFNGGQFIGGLTDYLGRCDYLRSPIWGPLGQRIYVIQYESPSCYEVGSYTVKFRDLAKTDWEVLFTVDNPPDSLGQTDYRLVRKIASGIPSGCTEPDDCEYLAVQISWKGFSSCGNLHLARVNDCNGADDTCLSGPVIAGTNPSWTKDGELLHTYQGWTNRDSETNCATNRVGLWDGMNLVSLIKGFEPTAASVQP
jgi:hypothetical protein